MGKEPGGIAIMIAYLCNTNLNSECRKYGCQELCFATTKEEYAKRDKDGKPIEFEGYRKKIREIDNAYSKK